MIFYTDKPSETFRLGDVVTGFVLASPHLESPPLGSDADYGVLIKQPPYAAVMTPCCSVGNHTVALAPLLPLNAKYFDNPYFVEDMTNINRPMTPEQAVSPTVWERLSPEERQRRLTREKPKMYGLVEIFVYAPHPLLPQYQISAGSSIADGHYQIDFRAVYRVDCNQIANTKQVPIATKRLELTIEARSELRKKLTHYFGRIPDEDRIWRAGGLTG